MTTIDERCKELGLKVYDTAIPQDWADAVRAKTGIYPVGHVVWCYDYARTFGAPVALTPEGERALALFREVA